eukprot:scaffold3195_cov162-Amphora_coffeaeformis.AAC.2
MIVNLLVLSVSVISAASTAIASSAAEMDGDSNQNPSGHIRGWHQRRMPGYETMNIEDLDSAELVSGIVSPWFVFGKCAATDGVQLILFGSSEKTSKEMAGKQLRAGVQKSPSIRQSYRIDCTGKPLYRLADPSCSTSRMGMS